LIEYTFLKEHEAHFCSKFKNKSRTIQPQQNSLKFLVKVVNKTAASAAQSTKCILLIHVQRLVSSCARTNKISCSFL